MSLPPRHLLLATLLHVVLFAFLFVGVQCTQPIEPTPVVQGVLINPNDLKALRPPTPPAPVTPKENQPDEGPQQIVKNTDIVADQAKAEKEKAEAEQQQKQEKAAEEQRQKEAAAKAEAELKVQQQVQKEADERAAAQKKQQEDDKRKAAEASEQQRKKELEEQIRKEAEEQQKAQAAAMAKKKQAEAAQIEADRRRAAAELQKQLGVETAQRNSEKDTNEWVLQLTAALTQAWARPPGTDQSLKAHLIITMAPGTGAVQSATISAGSGIPGFDDSVVRAAFRASPMPLPRDPSNFHRQVEVCFSPNPRNCEQ